MTMIVKSVTDVYDEYMASGDSRVTHWPLMESPGPTLALVLGYVLFVKKVGPSWMMDRKPYDLRYSMFLYNAMLVLTNFYLIIDTFKVLLMPNHSWTCRIDDKNDPSSIKLAELGWWFFFMKFIEFADTIFFVLRKKNNQISTLHVVHHAVVPIAVWGGFRIEPGSYNYFFPLLNTAVHTVMYSYYGLAALGPSVQKYLWWKKYLTTLQMVQFVMVFFYVLNLMITNCQVSKFIIYLNLFLAGLFLLMFYDYFRNTYKKKILSPKKEINHNTDMVNGNSVAYGDLVGNGKLVVKGKLVANGKSVANGKLVANGKSGANGKSIIKGISLSNNNSITISSLHSRAKHSKDTSA